MSMIIALVFFFLLSAPTGLPKEPMILNPDKKQVFPVKLGTVDKRNASLIDFPSTLLMSDRGSAISRVEMCVHVNAKMAGHVDLQARMYISSAK